MMSFPRVSLFAENYCAIVKIRGSLPHKFPVQIHRIYSYTRLTDCIIIRCKNYSTLARSYIHLEAEPSLYRDVVGDEVNRQQFAMNTSINPAQCNNFRCSNIYHRERNKIWFDWNTCGEFYTFVVSGHAILYNVSENCCNDMFLIVNYLHYYTWYQQF